MTGGLAPEPLVTAMLSMAVAEVQEPTKFAV